MFQGRRLVIATKHQKEIVIVPLIEKDLNVIHIPKLAKVPNL